VRSSEGGGQRSVCRASLDEQAINNTIERVKWSKMKIIYNTGPVTILEESGMVFTIYNSTLLRPEITIIGSYLNKEYKFTRITKDSTYGKKIMSVLNPSTDTTPPIGDINRLRKLISMLSGSMDLNKKINYNFTDKEC